MRNQFLLRVLLALSFSLLFGSASGAEETRTTFADIPDMYQNEARYLTERNIILGMPNGDFQPDRTVTRAEAATMIGRALGFDGKTRASGFPDVSEHHYASGYIAEAVENDIILGYTDGRFAPDDTLTRGQMSLLIQRSFPDLTAEHDAAFFDVTEVDYFHSSVMHIANSGVANGFKDATFRPASSVTRIQMALFMARSMESDFRVSPVPLPEQPAIAYTKTAQKTDQIITVVHTGSGHAEVQYWKKDPYVWQKVRSTTNGFVGLNGVSDDKVEGDRNAPIGSYGMPFSFGMENPGTQMPYRQITNRSYWISNVNDPQYNTWQERSSSHSHDEHLIRYQDQYKYAIAIDYNMNNPVPGKGSAIFLHVSNGTPTLGCVSVPESLMRYFMQELSDNARIIIAESEQDILAY